MAWIAADEGFNPDEMDQPVIGIASKLVRHDSGNHRHQKGQLLFAEKGVMTIRLGVGFTSVVYSIRRKYCYEYA